MKSFSYDKVALEQFPARCNDLVLKLHESKGKMDAVRRIYPGLLDTLRGQARLEGVDASLRLEGLPSSVSRVRDLAEGAQPRNDAEGQVAGLVRAYDLADCATEEPPAPRDALAFHAEIFGSRSFGGRSRYRRRDTMRLMIEGRVQEVSVSPVAAFETPLYLGAACDSLADAVEAHPRCALVLMGVFLVDFLCIKPFDEGSGRIARLLAHRMLVNTGFDVCRYVSVERLYAQDAAAYYGALNACVDGWERGANTYAPFVEYWLETLQCAYDELFAKTPLEQGGRLGKAERVRRFFEEHDGVHTKRAVAKALPDVGLSTIEQALGELVREGALSMVGGGRSTAYVRSTEQRA